MPRHALKRYCESAQKDVSSLQQVARPCIDDHLIPPEDRETTRGLSAVCAQIVLLCVYLARIGRPDLLWSGNTLARSATKWNEACDKRLLILRNYTNQTKNYRQSSHVVNQVDFKMLRLQVTCETQNQRHDVYCAYLDHTRLFQFRGCAKSKL